MTDDADLVERSLADGTAREFADRVDSQAAFLHSALDRGALENDGYTLGMELEVYAVDGDGRLAGFPDPVFDACGKELGLHNAEINTDPDPFTGSGIEAQAAAIESQLAAAREAAAGAGLEVVLDAMWTVPPAEGSHAYLAATEERDGLTVAENMRPDPRYYAIDRDCTRRAGGSIRLEVPGASHAFPSMLFESLATSIQPHLQVPETAAVPAHYNAAIRTLGPVLALATNSPFLPGDLYEVEDPYALLDRTHHELRIAAFERAVNHTDPPKCRVPEDVATPADVVDGVVADPVVAPFLREWTAGDGDGGRGGFADRFPAFDHKRGTFWRWSRCVPGGDPVAGACDARSLRIEYRPLPTQPTVRDVVGFQCLVAGLLRGLVSADHPVIDMEWAAAETAFYAAAEDGLDADLSWVTADGERTDDHATIYEDLFAHARRGLHEQGVPDATVERYLGPIEARWSHRTTPSRWKIRRVRERLDAGDDLTGALSATAAEYRRLGREHATFADWL